MAKRRTKPVPAYRLHKRSGQAVITLTDANTRRRRDVYLGEFDSPESRLRSAEVLAAWERAGRVLDGADAPPSKPPAADTVTALVVEYWRYQKEAKGGQDGNLSDRLKSIHATLKLLRSHYGATSAAKFGPLALQRLRVEMVGKKWVRSTVNDRVRIVQAAFKWAVSQEMVCPEVHTALSCVVPLKRGELGVREGRKVRPVDESHVEATLPHVSAPVAAIIRVQLLTAARGGELFDMRPMDLDTTGRVWVYTPESHKTEHLGHSRTIYLGPQAQEVITPLLKGRSLDACIFDPRDAEGRTGSVAKHSRYDKNSYKRAIERGCDRAFPPPARLARGRVPAKGRKRYRLETHREWKARLTPAQRTELKKWQKERRWHPHQLRHTAATKLRKEFGIEAARNMLGHRSAKVTEIYAERDHGQALKIAGKIG